MSRAKVWFSTLEAKNTFKPKVLTHVSHNGKWFVGSSMAVSHFLRPLCLCKRISYFKQGLKKAVVKFQPLETEDNSDWNSSSFWFKPVGYETEKRPCQNCMVMFQNLSGFLGSRDNLREEGVGQTILAACAEYIPTNKCLPDVAESDIEAVNVALTISAINFHYILKSFLKMFQSATRLMSLINLKRTKVEKSKF